MVLQIGEPLLAPFGGLFLVMDGYIPGAADGDGLDVKYLQKVVYGTSYQIPVDKQKGYWYVVRAYDGYGREHNPISIGMN